MDLHRAGLCHDDDGCDCGYCRSRRHQCDCCRAHHDRCCDRHDHCYYGLRDRCCCGCCCDEGCYDDCCYCDRHDPVHLHDVHRVQLACLRVQLIQFPNRQAARRRRQALDQQMQLPVLPAFQPLAHQPFLLALVQLLLALSAQGSSR